MPRYKNLAYFVQEEGGAFDQLFPPGEGVPYSGIYRCENDGFEIVCVKGRTFPPEVDCTEHHPEMNKTGKIQWRLVALPQHWVNREKSR